MSLRMRLVSSNAGYACEFWLIILAVTLNIVGASIASATPSDINV